MHSIRLKRAGMTAALALAAGVASADPKLEAAGGDAAETLTGDGLVAWVLRVNPGLAAVEAAAESAAFRIDPAGSLDDPMLSYAVAPFSAGGDRGLNQRVDFSQKIPWPGTLSAREAAARYDAVAADRDVDALRLRVTAQAKAAYAEWYFVHAALNIHHATRALLEELIATAETRYAVGRALKQDVLQAEVEHSDLDNQLLRLQRTKATVQVRINALLNRDPETPLAPAAPIRFGASLPPLGHLQTLALAQHPDLARLDARVSASDRRVTLAEKAFYPDFQVGVGYNSLWDDTNKRPIVGVSINVPLDRSKRRADLSRARADKRRAEWSLVEQRAELLADLAQARAEVVEAQASVALFEQELVPLAAEYLSASIADYQSGGGAFLNVITAEQRKLKTHLAMERARADYARRLADLERSIGGSIESQKAEHATGEEK
ncbi:MAG: TolC family protein [Gammaproteobacteria bacterium]